MGPFDQFLRFGVFQGVLGISSMYWPFELKIDVLVSRTFITSVNLVHDYRFLKFL